MDNKIRKNPHGAAFKFKVVLEALRGEKTVAELCAEHGIVSSQLFKWRKVVLDQGVTLFQSGAPTPCDNEKTLDQLHATIGRLKVENDFLGKVLGRSR